MCPLSFVLRIRSGYSIAGCCTGAEDPGQRYLRAAAREGVSPFDKKVYEQLAKIHRGNFPVSGGLWLLFAANPAWPGEASNRQPPDDAMDVLIGMGLDVLPVLTEALDDRTPSQTFKYYPHEMPRVNNRGRITQEALAEMRVGSWKVNELVAALICRIAERRFVIVRGRARHNIVEVGQSRELVPQFRKLVLDWYAENAKRTPLERRIADLQSDVPGNRCVAIAWIGRHKEKAGQKAVVRHLETILADRTDAPSRAASCPKAHLPWETSENVANVDLVRRVCRQLSLYAGASEFSDHEFDVHDLFVAYHGLALLGKKDEAIKQLDEFHKRNSAKWKPDIEEAYQSNLAKTGKW